MPRIKLQPLATYAHQVCLRIRVGDINYGNHLANNALLALIHEARIEWLAAGGFTELNLGDAATGLIMSDCVITFAAEAFMGDQLLIETQPAEVTSRSFRLHHRCTVGDKLVALVECGLVAFSYEKKRPSHLPAPILTWLR